MGVSWTSRFCQQFVLQKGLIWRVLSPTSKNSYPRFAYTLTRTGDTWKQHLELSNA